jgi:hypothetical protein
VQETFSSARNSIFAHPTREHEFELAQLREEVVRLRERLSELQPDSFNQDPVELEHPSDAVSSGPSDAVMRGPADSVVRREVTRFEAEKRELMRSLRTALDDLATENSSLRRKVGLLPDESAKDDPPLLVRTFVEGYGTLRGWVLGAEDEEDSQEATDTASATLPESVSASGTSLASWDRPGSSRAAGSVASSSMSVATGASWEQVEEAPIV